MRRVIAAALFALFGALSGSAQASTFMNDITDMWWNPDESGWGVNVILQKDVAFLTFFVYDAQGNPVWYSSDVHVSGVDDDGRLVMAGDLYATSGPWFGGSYLPSNVKYRKVGTAQFVIGDLSHALLVYSVNNVTVTKSLQRQTWRVEDLTGTYLGAFSSAPVGCNAANQDWITQLGGTMSVTHNDPNLTISIAGVGGSCTFNGKYTQTGRMGAVQGTYTCSDGTAGSFEAFDVAPSLSGFTSFVDGQNQYCSWFGTLGGVGEASQYLP